RARIAQSFALPPGADKPASPLRDVNQGEACHTDSGFVADQDRENITKTSTLPHDSSPRVTSPAIDEDRKGANRSGDDAPIKGRRLDVGEEAAERVSDDTEEMATILTTVEAATILSSGVAKVSTGSGSIPTVGPSVAEVPTGSDMIPTAGLIFATATVVTPYTRRKGKETMVESETLKKKRYHDNYAKVHKYQSQQRKPWSKKQKRDYYIAVIKSNLGWKVKDFRGMTFKEIEAKFTTVWKQIKNVIHMGLKEEA
nr:hypothetical protein [Tanacetum cinerariifolium]